MCINWHKMLRLSNIFSWWGQCKTTSTKEQLIGNWDKYQFKVRTQAQKQYSDSLIDPSFQWVNNLFFFIIWR